MTSTSDAETILDSALFFASRGVPVLPLQWPVGGRCSCGREDCDSPAKHPLAKAVPHGLSDASTDPDVIRRWWRRYPHANLGVCTGYAFDALDIDGEAGEASFLEAASKYGSPRHVGDVMTGREDGGLHLLTVPPSTTNAAGGRAGMPPGLDVRGRGGYVVAPPSMHISGQRYEWGSHFADGVLLGNREWDEWLADVKGSTRPQEPASPTFVQPTVFAPVGDAAGAYGAAVLRRAVGLVESATEGNRWHTLATEAVPLLARAVEGGCLDLETGVAALEDAGRSVGLKEIELRRVRGLAEDMLRKGIQKPIRPSAEPLQTFANVEEAQVEKWADPEPIDRPDPPPFPVEVLDWIADPVRDLSRRLQTPPDLAGMMTLALVAACVQGRAEVEVDHGWTEPLNLYLAVVLGSGETKSPLLAVLTKRLREVEEERQAEAAALIATRTDMQEVALARLKKAKDDAAKKGTIEAEVEVADARRRMDEIEVPVRPLFLAGDMTPEAMVKLLAEQGGNLGHISAEGGLLDTIVGGRYAQKDAPPAIADLLNAHDGREPIKVHRKNAEDLTVKRPSLTIGLAVQPQVLEALGKNVAAMRRGLAARFLFSVPKSLVGRRKVVRGMPVAESERAFAVLTDGILGDPYLRGLRDLRLKMKLEDSSSSLLDQWREHLEPRKHEETGDLGDLGPWINKLDGQVARLAGLLQIIRDTSPSLNFSSSNSDALVPGDRPVSPEAMSAALVLAEYLIEHAKAAFDLMGEDVLVEGGGNLADARVVRGWIRTHVEPGEIFRAGAAQQGMKNRNRFRTADRIHAAIDVLVATGWLWPVPAEKGTKPGPVPATYLVHPAVYQVRD